MNRKIVFEELKKGRTCVFHNEVIARNYAIEYAYEYDVIEADRAISYDTFKEYFLPNHDDLTQVNNQIREFFITDFLENNQLKYLISNEYPESIGRFTSYLINILKQLKSAVESDVFETLEEDFKDDVILLYNKYSEFLKQNNLFEPSFEDPSIDFAPKEILQKEYSIIACDTKAGCKKFLNKLNNPQFIHTINIEELDENDSSYQNNSKLIAFNNTDELQNTLFREVKKLLDGKILSRDIAITLCSFDKDIQDIELGAKRFGIPISKAKGYSLSKYPGGKYLIYLSNLYDNNFALDDMKGFFLERAFPFEDMSFNRELIRYAIDANIDHGSNKFEADYWITRLKNNRKLFDFYKRFKNLVIKLNTCETISDLQIALHRLENLILKKDQGWISTKGEKSYRYAIDKLDSINSAMKICKLNKTKQLYKLYIRLLENENYVEQGNRDGIRIFEYPLSASLDIPYHFVVDINNKSSEIIDKPLSLLPPTVEDQVLREEEDLTTSVIKDYCFNSGITYFLYSDTTYDGAQIAPPFFMERNSIIPSPFKLDYKPYIDEIDLWSSQKVDAKLTYFQSITLKRALTNVLSFTNEGYVNRKIEEEVNSFLLDKIKREGLLSFSATSINLFKKCPYAFALKYLFSIDRKDYNVVSYAPNEIGTIIHKVFQEFFEKVMKEDKQFYSSNKEKYIIWLDDIKENRLKEYFESEKSPPISTQIYILDKYKNFSTEFIDMEIKKFNTCRSEEMEETYISNEQILINDQPYFYSLNGKIDRVVNLGEGDFAIVDYKTGNPPIGSTWYKKAYEDKREDFPDYQFPCYKKLLEKKGANVVTACYYGVGKGSYFDMWQEGYPSDLKQIDITFDLIMKDMIIQILNGEFMTTPSDTNCQNCNYRQVCRKRYSTK
jgi:RecB family exonuclease